MKKLLVVIVLTVTTVGAQAQKGFRAGVRGALNSTWLFNKNTSDAGDELDYKAAFGSQVGVNTVYMFSEKAGVSLDILLGSVNQKYTNRFAPGTPLEITSESEAKMSTIDLPLLLRLMMGEDAYLEVGPQFSLINKVTLEVPGASTKVDDKFVASSYLSAVLGFGYDIALTDNLNLSPGLRFAWGLGDVYKEQTGQQGYEPTNAATGGINIALTYSFSDK